MSFMAGDLLLLLGGQLGQHGFGFGHLLVRSIAELLQLLLLLVQRREVRLRRVLELGEAGLLLLEVLEHGVLVLAMAMAMGYPSGQCSSGMNSKFIP